MAPTCGPPGCCAPTATPLTTAPHSSTPTTWLPIWWSALGRNHVRLLRQLGLEDSRIRMLRSFDPRSSAYALDVEDPYYGDHDDFEEVFAVIEAALPGLHDWVDERLSQNGQG